MRIDRPEMGVPSGKPVVIEVPVPVDDEGYAVIIGPGVLERLGREIQRRVPGAAKVALVSDANVMPLHGDVATRSLEAAGFEVHPIVVPPGEATKSPAQLLSVIDQMLAAGLGRADVLVALGGGVVGDLAGLAAALFMRGIAFVQCPTSLLAQVDASIGGKVAVDLPAGKNLLGAFHFPACVLVDTEVLGTLPERELGAGLAEMLKHGLLFSATHVHELCALAPTLAARDVAALGPVVAASVALKAACVRSDPHERAQAGKGRVLLNLGHTLGHALEAVSSFALLHGEAVALGLRAAARLSDRAGVSSAPLEPIVTQALETLRLPLDLDTWLAAYDAETLVQALAADKKRRQGTVTYIALAGVGEPRVLHLRPAEILDLLRPLSGAR